MAPITREMFAVANQTQIKVIKLTGDIDEVNFNPFQKEVDKILHDTDLRALVFDFQNLAYINSLLVGYLAKLYSNLSKEGRKVIIANASEISQDVIHMVGLHMIMDCVPTLEEAIALIVPVTKDPSK